MVQITYMGRKRRSNSLAGGRNVVEGKSESRYEEASSSKVSQRENVDFDPTITRD